MARRNQLNALMFMAAGAGALYAAREIYRHATAYDFRGKTVLITGGSRGLGLILARQFAEEGARIVICARDEEELGRAREQLQRRAFDVLAVQCDVTRPAQIQGMIDGVRLHFGRIDVLVNNAGTIEVGPVETMTMEDFREAMDVHFWGPLHLISAVVPQMKQFGGGRIVNISSIGGKISPPHLLPYNASKFALTGLSEGLRAELAKDNIKVTTVIPGLMRTGSPKHAFFKGQHRKEYAWFSISDSLRLTSMSAERAAGKIIDACRHGDAELVLTVQAKLAQKLHGLFPGLMSDVMGFVNRFLPGPDGIGTRRLPGHQSESSWSPSSLTELTEEAARRNNETGSSPADPHHAT